MVVISLQAPPNCHLCLYQFCIHCIHFLMVASQYDLVWYSDDGGETYILSETVLEKMDEAQLVELSDGRVMANMRNDHLTSCDCRAVAISTNGGKTFGDISYDPSLVSPVRLRLPHNECYV